MFTKRNGLKRQLGLTLFDMMITLAIAAILITVVAPNVNSMMVRNHIVADINDTSSALQFARFTAVDRQVNTVFCPSANFSACSLGNWNFPKIVFIDKNLNGNRDEGENLLFTTEQVDAKNNMSGPNSIIRFDPSGASNVSASILLCPGNDDPKLARELNVNLQGRVRLSKDANNDGVHEKPNGDKLSCI